MAARERPAVVAFTAVSSHVASFSWRHDLMTAGWVCRDLWPSPQVLALQLTWAGIYENKDMKDRKSDMTFCHSWNNRVELKYSTIGRNDEHLRPVNAHHFGKDSDFLAR